jgi:hypothetical protein
MLNDLRQQFSFKDNLQLVAASGTKSLLLKSWLLVVKHMFGTS